MTAESLEIAGDLFEPGRAASRPARLLYDRRGLTLRPVGQWSGHGETVKLSEVSDRVAGVPRRAALADGRSFVTPDDEGIDRLMRVLGRRSSKLHIWERLTVKRLAIFAVLLVVAGFALRAAVPFAADYAANSVPESWERHIGETAYTQLNRIYLEESNLPTEKQAEINAIYDRLLAESELNYRPDLHMVAASGIGPNALALPGGPILVTDSLVRLADSNEELAGVLAHELAHVEARHGLRKVLRYGGWVMLANVVFADSGSLIGEVGSLAALTATQAYSRDFEAEADLRGAQLMQASGIGIEPFIAIMTKLGRHCGDACETTGLWDSHPAMPDRIDSLRELQPQ